MRDSIGNWYSAAIDDAAIVPVDEPDLDLGELPAHGAPLTFSIEIGVRPEAKLGEYKGLEVGKRDPEVADEAIDAEIERLRERSGRLETVDRAAAEGDFVVMDYRGTIDGTAFAGGGRDQMVELGSGRLVPGFEDQLAGATAGEERTVTVSFPDDYGAPELAGQEAEFTVTVKEVKAKELPDVDDDLAAEAGFDTLDEAALRHPRATGEAEERRIDAEFRETVLDAAVANATIDVPERSRTPGRASCGTRWSTRSATRASRRRCTFRSQAGRRKTSSPRAGRTRRQLKREAVLAAIVAAEEIEPSDEDVLEALEDANPAEHEREEAARAAEVLRQARLAPRRPREPPGARAPRGVGERLTVEQARARDKLWTPDKGAPEGTGTELWTPGS